MVDSINAIGAMNTTFCAPKTKKSTPAPVTTFTGDNATDTVEISTKNNAPQISKTRLFFSRLTDEQIEAINKSGKLPDNAKFVQNGFGGFVICNNFFGLRAGTQTLPAGFEVKKNILGFTCVLPKGTNGIFIKS